MGCIVFNKNFVDKNKDAVDAFLAEYKASIEYINDKKNLESSAEMIFNAGILPKAAIAKKALMNLYGSIVYIDGAEMKTALEGFYKVIGLAKPDANFYYGK
jgi:NitT/TauT family transport system substrate-binding protein